jgi:hypothetical protein
MNRGRVDDVTRLGVERDLGDVGDRRNPASGSSAPECVQLSVRPEVALQSQPVPDGRPTKLSSSGSVSVTVAGPIVGASPTLVTRRVNVA